MTSTFLLMHNIILPDIADNLLILNNLFLMSVFTANTI